MKGAAVLLFFAPLLVSAPVFAGGTSVWELSSKEHFDAGTLEKVVVFAPGGVRLGPSFRKFEVEEVGVWSIFIAGDGTIYAGTARTGSVYKLAGDKMQRILKTEELAVTDMAMDGQGNLYASTIPEGKIFRIAPDGKESVYRIPDSFAWKLLIAPDGNIYVASGPAGKVYLMENGGGWIKEVFKSDREKNIISMAAMQDGSLLCGSAENGVLYRIEPGGKASAVHNFPEKEIRDIAVHQDSVWVATNISQKGFKQEAFVGELADVLRSEAEGAANPEAKKEFKKLLNGKVYRMDREGRAESLLSFQSNFALSLAVTSDGSAVVGCGQEGRVFSVDGAGNVFTLVDLAEEQVIALKARAGELYAMGTGYPGKLYVADRSPAESGSYLSEVHDSGFPAVYGNVFWQGRGAVSFRTRSGNTEKPDETWSAWSEPLKESDSRVTSPRARFFQFRIEFGDRKSVV